MGRSHAKEQAMDEHDPARDEAMSGGETPDPPAPLNREQRRARRFGRHANHIQDNLQPQSRNNPAFGSGEGESASREQADEGVTDRSGAGTAGATESDGRLVHHEGMHLGNEPNS
jgi:hypothetical protein